MPAPANPDAGTAPAPGRPARGPALMGFATGLDAAILAAVTRSVPSHVQGPLLPSARTMALPPELATDPAGALFTAWSTGALPADLAGRARVVREALATSQRSLGFAALAWRVLAEPILAGDDAASRPPAVREALAQTLAAARVEVERWRQEIFTGRLDPYLARGRVHMHHKFELAKAPIPPPPWIALGRDTYEERWGPPQSGVRESTWAREGFLARHAYGESMRLHISGPAERGVVIETLKGRRPLAGRGVMGVFDLLVTPRGAAPIEVILGARQADAPPLALALPPGAELSYADLLALADAQHGAALDRAATTTLTELYDRAGGVDPRLHGAVQRRASGADAALARPAAWWLADFWLF